MFDFHYDYIRQKYDDAAEFLFTDTDSLMYLNIRMIFTMIYPTILRKSLILLIIPSVIHLV